MIIDTKGKANIDVCDILRKHNIEVTNKQREAIYAKGNVCCVACPGSGKTLVYVARIAKMIMQDGINPNKILALTFSKASAVEMEERFNKWFGEYITGKVGFSTIHSFSYKVVRKVYNKKFTLIEGTDTAENKNRILRAIYSKVNDEFIPDDKLDELSNIISYLKNSYIPCTDREKVAEIDYGIENLQVIYKEYENYKFRNNYIDFDDMLILCYRVLKTMPQVLQAYREQYQHILIDEVQDTSLIQHMIIELLVLPDNNIFIVGDDDQSIYSFRAATPERMLNFRRIYPNAKILCLSENFRSTKTIVSTADRFILKNRQRFRKNIFTNNEEGDKIEILRTADECEQLDFIVERLKNLKNYNSTAILYRNNISAIGLLGRLTREGIPFYTREAKKDFFAHWVISGMLNFIRFGMDNEDAEAFLKIAPRLYISKEVANNIVSLDNGRSILDNLINAQSSLDLKVRFQDLKHKFSMMKNMPPSKAISFVETAIGYEDYLRNQCSNSGISFDAVKSMIANLNVLASMCGSNGEFFGLISAVRHGVESSVFNKNKNAVTLSTVHSAKGLEFDNVFVIDMIDGVFPTRASIQLRYEGDFTAFEEERRLCYVAITRARKNLALLSPTSQNGYKADESAFVGELENIINPGKRLERSAGRVEALSGLSENNLLTRYRRKPSAVAITGGLEPTEKIDFKVNDLISHKKYGKGKVVAVSSDSLEVDFGEEVRKLNIAICIKNRIIKVL